jgi:hypothetical protein
MVNGLRKIARASVFHLKRQHIYKYIYIYKYIHKMDQMVNGLRKIAGASIFWLKQQHIYTCVYKYIYMQNRTEGKTAVSICLLQTENGKSKLPFVCCKQKRKLFSLVDK